MTTSRETVHNAALSGAELKRIILADFEKLLVNEGYLSDYMAFGRVGYEITIRLHLDNPLTPEALSHISSRAIGQNLVRESPQLGAVEPAPLDQPSPEALAGASAIRREIDSPNEERLRNDMPVPVIVQQQDGTKTVEYVKYPKDIVEGEGKIIVSDRTEEARAAWGLPPLAAPEQVDPRAVIEGSTVCYCGYDRNSHALSGLSTQPQKEGFPKCSGFAPADSRDPNKKEAWPVEPS